MRAPADVLDCCSDQLVSAFHADRSRNISTIDPVQRRMLLRIRDLVRMWRNVADGSLLEEWHRCRWFYLRKISWAHDRPTCIL